MKNELTQEQIDFYQENGYIIIEDFLSPDELETGGSALTMRWRDGETASWLIGAKWTTRAKKASIAACALCSASTCGRITKVCAN